MIEPMTIQDLKPGLTVTKQVSGETVTRRVCQRTHSGRCNRRETVWYTDSRIKHSSNPAGPACSVEAFLRWCRGAKVSK
jgi:hypothetical protein